MLGVQDRFQSTAAIVITVLLLALQWLLASDRKDRASSATMPVFGWCLVMGWVVGVRDLLTLLAVAAAWHGLNYACREGFLRWILGLCCVFACIFSCSYYQGMPLLTVSFFVPCLLFWLARTEGTRLCMLVMAISVAWQPLPDPVMGAIWTGLVALLAAAGSAALRRLASTMVKGTAPAI